MIAAHFKASQNMFVNERIYCIHLCKMCFQSVLINELGIQIMIRLSTFVFILLLPVFAFAATPSGSIDPAVTQDNINQTICVKSYANDVRPPDSYTRDLKIKQMHEQALPGSPSDYEEDHLIPLELGGSPTDENNLWPEPLADAHRKATEANRLNQRVCSGLMTLDDAQDEIRAWKQQ
jgi:hypothetical protein